MASRNSCPKSLLGGHRCIFSVTARDPVSVTIFKMDLAVGVTTR